MVDRFDKTIALLNQRGWRQGLGYHQNDAICLGIALDLTMGVSKTDAHHKVAEIIVARGGNRSTDSLWTIIFWNDDPKTTFEDVVSVLEQAKQIG